MRDVLDLHTHTIASGHAYNTMMEMIHEAQNKGLDVYGITEHAPRMKGTCTDFYFHNLKVVPRKHGDLELLLGVELNILDEYGTVDLEEPHLGDMDVTIASLHKPCIQPGSRDYNTQCLISAMKNPHINIIGHPDDGKFPLDYEAVVKAAKDNHRMIELNNTSLTPGGSRIHAYENDRIILPLCASYKVPVIMNSDAHFTTSVGDHARAEALLKELNFPETLIANYHPEILKEYIPDLADFQG
mgnify:CR=1 FL=1